MTGKNLKDKKKENLKQLHDNVPDSNFIQEKLKSLPIDSRGNSRNHSRNNSRDYSVNLKDATNDSLNDKIKRLENKEKKIVESLINFDKKYDGGTASNSKVLPKEKPEKCNFNRTTNIGVAMGNLDIDIGTYKLEEIKNKEKPKKLDYRDRDGNGDCLVSPKKNWANSNKKNRAQDSDAYKYNSEQFADVQYENYRDSSYKKKSAIKSKPKKPKKGGKAKFDETGSKSKASCDNLSHDENTDNIKPKGIFSMIKNKNRISYWQ